eukprot:5760838-Prymnesium_polylepis.1
MLNLVHNHVFARKIAAPLSSNADSSVWMLRAENGDGDALGCAVVRTSHAAASAAQATSGLRRV